MSSAPSKRDQQSSYFRFLFRNDGDDLTHFNTFTCRNTSLSCFFDNVSFFANVMENHSYYLNKGKTNTFLFIHLSFFNFFNEIIKTFEETTSITTVVRKYFRVDILNLH